jgi:hypothetical protein
MIGEITTARCCGAVEKERTSLGGQQSHPETVGLPLTYKDFYEGGQQTSVEAILAWSLKR